MSVALFHAATRRVPRRARKTVRYAAFPDGLPQPVAFDRRRVMDRLGARIHGTGRLLDQSRESLRGTLPGSAWKGKQKDEVRNHRRSGGAGRVRRARLVSACCFPARTAGSSSNARPASSRATRIPGLFSGGKAGRLVRISNNAQLLLLAERQKIVFGQAVPSEELVVVNANGTRPPGDHREGSQMIHRQAAPDLVSNGRRLPSSASTGTASPVTTCGRSTPTEPASASFQDPRCLFPGLVAAQRTRSPTRPTAGRSYGPRPGQQNKRHCGLPAACSAAPSRASTG